MEGQNLPIINMILLRHGNHAELSGYDRICDHLPARVVRRVERLDRWQKSITRLLRPLHRRSGSQWYGRAGLLAELAIVPLWLRRSGQIFHFLYGENSFRYAGILKHFRNNFIVCTYHAPPQRFAEVVKDRAHLQGIDAVILVSRVSYDTFAELLGPERVHFIPHGVDTDFFRPTEKMPIDGAPFHCLFVGSHLRDFELLADVARHFELVRPDFRFEVITLKQDFGYFSGLSNVNLRNGISDEELRSAYQRADVLLMPLTDATANNSLLEGMACGLPMIVSDLPGVRDYVDETSARLVPVGDRNAFINALLALSIDAEDRALMSKQARAQAMQFSFPVVARMTQDLYLQLVERTKPLGTT